MPDMLVRLYDLLSPLREVERQAAAGIVCRRAESYERSALLAFVTQHFPAWRDELLVGFAQVPPTVLIAVERGDVCGFACYNVTRPNYFGPTGVDHTHRGRGIGKVLLLQCLDALQAEGYGYAIIGGVGPQAFYERAVGATLIPGSEPGIYRDRISQEEAR